MQKQSVVFKIFHKYKKYEITGKFKGLFDIDDSIFTQLINHPNHEYYSNSEVSEETFSLFIEYLVSEKPPLITFDNLYEFEALNEEFKNLRETVEKVKNNFDEYELNLYKLQHMKNTDTKSIEKEISNKLDSYIEKQGDKLMNLDIQTLYNIFISAEGKFSKHNEAYELIKKHYSKNKDDSIFILLPFLEGEKLDRSNLQETILESNKRFGFFPKKEVSFYDNILSKFDEIFQINEEQNKKIEEQNKKIEEQNKKIEELQKERNKEKEEKLEQNKKIDELDKEKLEQNKKLKEFETEKLGQNKKIDELDKEIRRLKEEISKIKRENQTTIQKQDKENEKIKQQIKEEDKKITEIKRQQQEEISKIKRESQTTVQKQEKENEKTKQQIKEEISKNQKQNEQQQQKEISKIEQKKNLLKNQIKKSFQFESKNEFKGIINYLKSNSHNIFDEINISSSSIYQNNERFSPKNSIIFDNPNVEFCSGKEKNPWLCFDFKKHRIILKSYTIRSFRGVSGNNHPRSWVIEGSNNDVKWETIDIEKDCPHLNGNNFVHTFNVSNQTNQEYQFVRMHITGPDWSNSNYLDINCIEFYGSLI